MSAAIARKIFAGKFFAGALLAEGQAPIHKRKALRLLSSLAEGQAQRKELRQARFAYLGLDGGDVIV